MTVGELIEQLKDYDPKTLVIQSSDPEGNSISETHEISDGNFNRRTGDFGSDTIGSEDYVSGPFAICFWPHQ